MVRYANWMYEIGGLRARLVPLTGEIVSAAALRSYRITGEERSGIPLLDLAEAGGGQHVADLFFRPADLFHALSVAAPKTAFLHEPLAIAPDRKSTRLNSSHLVISYAVF